MSEKIVKAVISAIPTVILVVCVVAAFATQGWDVQATLVGDKPIEVLETLVPVPAESAVGEELKLLEVTDFRLSDDGTKRILEAVFHSPLNVPVTIKELSADVIMDGNSYTVSLPNEVEIPAKGSASLTLEGALLEVQTPSTLPSAGKFTLSNMRMTLDISGIELQIEESEPGGR